MIWVQPKRWHCSKLRRVWDESDLLEFVRWAARAPQHCNKVFAEGVSPRSAQKRHISTTEMEN